MTTRDDASPDAHDAGRSILQRFEDIPGRPELTSEDFGLDIEYVAREHSKDSSTRRFVIVVDGDRVFYHGPVGEGVRGQFRHAKRTFELSAARRARLREIIRDRQLLTSVEELRYDAETKVPFRDVAVDATFVVDGETGRIRLEGPVGGHRMDPDQLLEHRDTASDVESICMQFDRWIREDEGSE